MKGKIANVASIPVLPLSSTQAPTKVSSAFSGDSAIQFIRIASYGLGTIAFLVAVVAIFFTLSHKIVRNGQRRKQLLSAEVHIQDFLQQLDNRARHALEPIARAILTDERIRCMLLDEFRSLLRKREYTSDDEASMKRQIDMIIDDLRKRLPHIDREYFRKEPAGIKQLTDLLILAIDIEDF